MSLTPEQTMLIGVVTTVIVFGLNLAAQKFNWKPGRRWLTVGLYAVAFLLAIAFFPKFLPSYPQVDYSDPAAWAGALVGYTIQLLQLLLGVVGLASTIYNLIVKQVLEGLTETVRSFFAASPERLE